MTDPKATRPATGGAATDLPEDVQQRIDELHGRLGTVDHYTLLGVARTATRAQVRSAFLQVAPRFHPDRFFGKKLGVYAEKMQRIFGHLSIAHDTLVNDETRAKYDAQLPPPIPGSAGAIPAAAPRKGPPPLPGQVAREGSSPEPSPESARRGPPTLPGSPTPFPPSGVQGSAPVTGSRIAVQPRAPTSSRPDARDSRPETRDSQPAMRQASSPEMDRAKAQAFAARLGGHQSSRMRAATPAVPFAPTGAGRPLVPGGAVRTSSSPTNPAIDPKAAAESLRRRYEEKVQHARSLQTSQHVQAARAAEERGDYVEAARMYTVALSHSSDATLRAAKDHAEARAKEQTQAHALARAKEAEQKKDFAEAAVAWARVFDLTPSADTAHRAAMCFRRAGTDSRRAAKYGEEAVKLEPGKAIFRVTLAFIYVDAGLPLRAKGEIERAQALEPNSQLVKDAVARIKGK